MARCLPTSSSGCIQSRFQHTSTPNERSMQSADVGSRKICCDYVLLGGHFWPKFGDGALKYFDRDVPSNPVLQNSNSKSECFLDTLFMFIFVFGDAIWSFRGFAISFLHISSDNVVIGLTLSRPCCWERLIFGGCGGQSLSAREYGLYRNDLVPAFWLCHFPKISSPHLCFCLNIIQVIEIKPKQQAVENIANF